MNKGVRINKFIADAGLSSRRGADQLILDGKIKVNGETLQHLGYLVKDEDYIELEGKTISRNFKERYLALNKPTGYVCSASDELGRKTIFDLIKDNDRLFSVGRLDMASQGLIILTNDGYFAQKLTHPSARINKIYYLTVSGERENIGLLKQKFTEGVKVDGTVMTADRVEMIKTNSEHTTFRVSVHTGYNRQLRKMAEVIGLKTKKLQRVQIGNLKLGDLKPGEYRIIKPSEVLGD